MSNDPRTDKIEEATLHAYVDGQLSPKERARVEAWLAEHPEDGARVREWRHQNAALEALFATSEAEQRVAGMVRPQTGAPGRPLWGGAMRLAAALVLVAIGIGGGWLTRGIMAPDRGAVAEILVNEAMNAHLIYTPEVLHPVEVAASNEDHLISWLSKRLGASLVAPDLSADGFSLIGGRLLPADDGPAAQFMYENEAGSRLTVYVRVGTPGTLAAFRFETRGDVGGVYWQDERLRYAVIGSLPRAELSSIATEIYRQMI